MPPPAGDYLPLAVSKRSNWLENSGAGVGVEPHAHDVLLGVIGETFLGVRGGKIPESAMWWMNGLLDVLSCMTKVWLAKACLPVLPHGKFFCTHGRAKHSGRRPTDHCMTAIAPGLDRKMQMP